MARCNRLTLWGKRGALGILLYLLGIALAPTTHATMKYGPIELSGSVDSQSLFRSAQIDDWQWIQNRNTALIRLDYDSFWDIAPGGRQKGVTSYDDMIGGPISGHDIGETTTRGCPSGTFPCAKN